MAVTNAICLILGLVLGLYGVPHSTHSTAATQASTSSSATPAQLRAAVADANAKAAAAQKDAAALRQRLATVIAQELRTEQELIAAKTGTTAP